MRNITCTEVEHKMGPWKSLLLITPLLILSFTAVVQHSSTASTSALLRSDGSHLASGAYFGSTCRSDKEIDRLIASAKQIFLLSPPKAAGSSMIAFASQCVGRPSHWEGTLFDPHKDGTLFLTESFDIPPLLSGHVDSDETLINVAKHTNDDVLLLFAYRNERDRFISAIKHVVDTKVCPTRAYKFGGYGNLAEMTPDNKCLVKETDLLEKIIGPGAKVSDEIDQNNQNIFTCSFYDAIIDNAPNMVFMHYKEVNKIQTLLAKRLCPEVQPAQTNSEQQRKERGLHTEIILSNGTHVNLADYIEAKRNILELSLQLNEGITCQAKTKKLEEQLNACSSRFVTPLV